MTRSAWVEKISSLLNPFKAPMLSADRYSLAIVIHISALIGFVCHFLFILLFLWLDVQAMAAVNVVSCLVFLFCMWVIKHNASFVSLFTGFAEVIVHAWLAVSFLGWESGFHYYVLALIPLVFYARTWSVPVKVFLVVVLWVVYIGLYLFSHSTAPWHPIDPNRLYLVGIMNITALCIFFSVLAHVYRSAAVRAEAAFVQANQKLAVLANTDPLTGLLNRRNMESIIHAAVEKFNVTKQPFSLILCDIDNFKVFNDSYGHLVGDKVLVTAAATLRGCIREQDLVSRWGGEEFLLFLPGTTSEEARSIAERLRATIAGTSMACDGQEYSLTMTFGVAMHDDTGVSKCIDNADKALYQGKRQGKNCVVCAVQ